MLNVNMPKHKRYAIVVDDDPIFFEYYIKLLDRLGYNIEGFDNEKDAMVWLNDHSPHIAFIHFQEDIDRTINFISEINKHDKSISIIYVSGWAGKKANFRATKAGAYRVVEKDEKYLGSRQFEDEIEKAFEISLQKKSKVMKAEIFVLMPFAKRFTEIYRLGIKEPMEQMGFRCNRVDEIQFTGNIIDHVYFRIENATIIIADMTGMNPNVFYEVGYAHGLGKNVILLTQKIEDIPFDLRAKKHIIYGRSILKLRNELTETVRSILDEFKPN